MYQPATPSRSCPACGSGEYTFRSRKKIAGVPGKGEREAAETRYRCKACEHEWKVRVAVKDAG